MEMLSCFISALVLGAVAADWSHRRDLLKSVTDIVAEMNRTLLQIGEVHNKQTSELAALSERVSQIDIKSLMVGRSPFGKQ